MKPEKDKSWLVYKTILVFLVICPALMVNIQSPGAHPHTFIGQRIKIVFDKDGLEGFHIYWAFDEMFSTMISSDFDTDQNNILDKEEVRNIKEKAFAYIAPYNYYINIKIGKTPFPVKFIQKFNAALENKKVLYDFFIPCHVRAVKTLKKIVIAPYDPEYYSAIYFLDKNPCILENSDSFDISTSIKTDKSTSIYYDMVNPWALFLEFQTKQ